jgi:uncharacterized oligopeptide transporter (OPT) family protein
MMPKILGIDFRTLGLRFTVDLAMFGVGGLMGIRVASSLLFGSLLNFAFLAPLMIQRGDIVERIAPSGKVVPISRVEILNQWGLWWAVSIMVVGSIVTLAAKPEIFTGYSNLSAKRKSKAARFGEKYRIAADDFLYRHPAFSVLAADIS